MASGCIVAANPPARQGSPLAHQFLLLELGILALKLEDLHDGDVWSRSATQANRRALCDVIW
jgi:hypothetical protein